MSSRQWSLTIAIGLVLGWALFACAPGPNLPAGPTAIPTLIPATDAPQGLNTTPTAAFAIMSYPAQSPRAEAGEGIYQAECASCHGVDGTGAIPEARNFRDLDYMRGETPASFYVAITEGRGGMPAYQERISSDERWDVVFFIWRLSTTGQILEQGEQVYDENCAVCHGESGGGDLLGSADFTDLRQMDQLAPRDLYLAVTQGRGSMPSWQARLSQDTRWAVIDYLRTFSYDPTLSGEPSAPTAAVTEQVVTAACEPDQSNPVDWDDAAAVTSGQVIYDARCAACHGQDGSGALPNTPDFTSAAWNEGLLASAGSLYCLVAEGTEAMPAFNQVLDENELWQVITFLASLG
jgi:mono/diheme cytochrome c family protein